MSLASKEQPDIDFFEGLFRLIWARIVPILGILNVKTMLEHALEEGRVRHPILCEVHVREDGIRLVALKQALRMKQVTPEDAREALRDYLASLVHLLARLSGNVVSDQVYTMVEDARQKKRIKQKIL